MDSADAADVERRYYRLVISFDRPWRPRVYVTRAAVRFSGQAMQTVAIAGEHARARGHNYIGTEHILLSVIRESHSEGATVLDSLGINLEGVRQQVEEIIGRGQQEPSGDIPFTPRAKKVLELSQREALRMGDHHAGSEHIVLGLIAEGEGVAAQVLMRLGADSPRVRRQVIQLAQGSGGPRPFGMPPEPDDAQFTPLAKKILEPSLAEAPDHGVTHSGIGTGLQRFTDRARRVVVLAQEEARMLNHDYIGTEHILLGLIHEGEGVAAQVLDSLGMSLEAVRQQVEEIIGRGHKEPSGDIPFTPRAEKVLGLSLSEALQLGHNYIGTEHLLLGLIRECEGVAAQVLVRLGADLNEVRQQVIQELTPVTRDPDDEAELSSSFYWRRRPRMAGTIHYPARITDAEGFLPVILARLDSIDWRLAVIEKHLGAAAEDVEPADGAEP